MVVEEKYMCPICREVLKKPTSTRECLHRRVISRTLLSLSRTLCLIYVSLCAGSARAVCVRCGRATTEITTVHSVGVPSKCRPPSRTYRLRGSWVSCTSPVPAANTRSVLSALFVLYHRLLLLEPCWFHDLMEVVRSNCVHTMCVVL